MSVGLANHLATVRTTIAALTAATAGGPSGGTSFAAVPTNLRIEEEPSKDRTFEVRPTDGAPLLVDSFTSGDAYLRGRFTVSIWYDLVADLDGGDARMLEDAEQIAHKLGLSANYAAGVLHVQMVGSSEERDQSESSHFVLKRLEFEALYSRTF